MALTTKNDADMSDAQMRYAEQLGRVLAEAASLEPLVEEVWVSTHPGGVRLWLITQDVDDHQEYELHGLADILYERFNRPDFEVFVMNPRHSRGDIHSAIPRRSVQIPLPAR
jgi:hypothetical protein